MKYILTLAIAWSLTTLSLAKEDKGKSPGNIRIELNKLEQSGANCTAFFILKNHTGLDFAGLKTELIIFDAQGIIQTRLLGNFKKLPANKTLVKLFGIPQIKCDSIGEILINDVHDCKVSNTKRSDCLDLLEPKHKSTTKLFK